MSHQPVTRVERPGYTHLPPDDRPYTGIHRETCEQILWKLFHAEATLRRVYELTHDPKHIPDLQERFAQIEQLPVDR